MARYLIRTYDTYFNDVRNDYVSEYADDETAINAAKSMLHLLIHPADTCEMQVCCEGMCYREWVMFAAVYYCDDDIVVDYCYC